MDKQKELENKVIEVCEDLGWWVNEYGDYLEIGQASPLGEDFFFTITKNNIIQDIKKYAYDFDADEHAEMWLEYRGTRGVPKSIRALLNDADEIQKMLYELADAVVKIEVE